MSNVHTGKVAENDYENMAHYRFRRKNLFTTLLGMGTFLICLKLLFGRAVPVTVNQVAGEGPLPCSQLPGAEDVLVVLKTGATELQDKLPVHFHTTLRCYPDYMIYSDHEEDYEGHHVTDALTFVNETLREQHDDFALWRRLRAKGRAALSPDELSGADSKVSPMTGKKDNPGWKLDKWKFLPMVNRTLNEYPDKKWYVFVETDTYLFWSTLLSWVRTMDYKERWYIGAQMQIGDVVFAHGGSGFIASHATMRTVVDFFVANQANWEMFTDSHWAGDCVLGKAMLESGSPLQWAWPTIQGVKPGGIKYEKHEYGNRLWCFPTVSYHHLSPAEVEEAWRYEQETIQNVSTTPPTGSINHADKPQGTNIVYHSDMFKDFVLPRITSTKGTKTQWDNLSGDWEKEGRQAESFSACQQQCIQTAGCCQFAFSNGTCQTTTTPMWGENNVDVQSGWLLDRVDHFWRGLQPCDVADMWFSGKH